MSLVNHCYMCVWLFHNMHNYEVVRYFNTHSSNASHSRATRASGMWICCGSRRLNLCTSLSLRQSGTANAILLVIQDWGDAELGWHQFIVVFSPFSPFQLFPLQCKIQVKSRETYSYQALSVFARYDLKELSCWAFPGRTWVPKNTVVWHGLVCIACSICRCSSLIISPYKPRRRQSLVVPDSIYKEIPSSQQDHRRRKVKELVSREKSGL